MRIGGRAVVAAALVLLPTLSVCAESEGFGTLSGVIQLPDGRPVSGGKVAFFSADSGPPPKPSRYLRSPDEVTELAEAGSFVVTLPSGAYYLSAVVKANRALVGSPVEGDFVYPSARELQDGTFVYRVQPGRVTDLGSVVAVPFLRPPAVLDGVTAVEGVFRDARGDPISGAIALAFDSPSATGRPLFLSERTGADGKYRLGMDKGGVYYLKVRTSLRGGHPEEGELLGVYGGGVPAPVSVRTGETQGGVDVTGTLFLNSKDWMKQK